MKLHYRKALVSFCQDLTNPESSSVPVGILLVAEGENGSLVATAAGIWAGILKLDPISREIITDLPQLIKRHLSEVRGSLGPNANIDSVLFGLHDTLRNSLHVSGISETEALEVESPSDSARLVSIAIENIQNAVTHWIATDPNAESLLNIDRLKPVTPNSVRTEANLWPMHKDEEPRVAMA